MSDAFELLPLDNGTTVTLATDISKVPMTIICNGFSMKEVIIECLLTDIATTFLGEVHLKRIADAIQEAFAVKLRMKQGEI